MDATQEFFISVLRSYIINDVSLDASDVDWPVFSRLCRIHNVGGMAYATLKKARVAVPPDEKKCLEENYYASICYSIKQAEAFKAVSEALEENGVPYIPIKGLVLKELYPNPELRTMGDMDLLVHDEDRPKCHEIMTELGYTRLAHEFEWLYENNQVEFEIHSAFKSAYDIIIGQTDIWDNAENKGASKHFEMNQQYHLVLLLSHAAKHAFAGFGIRMIIDISLWLRFYRNRIDAKALAQELNCLRILEFAKRVFALGEKYFGIKSPFDDYIMSDSTYEEMCAYIVEGGTFGKDNRSFTGLDQALVREYLFNNSALRSRFNIFGRTVFLPYKVAAKRYKYLEDRPYFLPIAWIQRWLGTLFKHPDRVIDYLKGIFGFKKAAERISNLRDFGL
ncbi:MAG: hypothetical protein EOM59_10230 [Clostridia bacterium]|nr:hypothetical protein [Clostridia bacterium]